MNTKVEPIPNGYHTVTPYLTVKGGATAMEFYQKAFGAKEIMRLPGPDGKVMHAEIQIGDSRIMFADEFPEMGAVSPATLGGCASQLMLYVVNVDEFVERAVAAGAKMVRPVQDQFYGDRSGTVSDPFGHRWTIATHVEDVSEEELQKRMAAMGGECG
jgi:PhnB protein